MHCPTHKKVCKQAYVQEYESALKLFDTYRLQKSLGRFIPLVVIALKIAAHFELSVEQLFTLDDND